MKVYVVESDNGMLYGDTEYYFEGVRKSFRGATEYLLEEGFIPYPVKGINDTYGLEFEKDGKNTDKAIEAFIREFYLKD